MAELSLCMIVRDEEENLPRCLESVRRAVDEIVIVDTGSTDATVKKAARYTDRIYEHAWENDFASARNISFSYATKPYILWLDADDVMDADACEKLIELKAELDGTVDAVMMPYYYAFAADGRPTLVFDRERIVRKDAGFLFSGAVHEAMAVGGRIIRADIAVRHTGRHGKSSNRRNLTIYEKLMEGGEALAPRDLYYYARELKSAGEYERAEAAFSAFLKRDGWMENRIDAYVQRGECLCRMERREEAKASFYSAMAMGTPRAEAVCALGACLMEEGNLEAAAFWYCAALLCPKPTEHAAFVVPQAYDYIPLMQLCVCYDRMGKTLLASQMNERALLACPGDAAALANRAYFERALKRAQKDALQSEEEKTGQEA